VPVNWFWDSSCYKKSLDVVLIVSLHSPEKRGHSIHIKTVEVAFTIDEIVRESNIIIVPCPNKRRMASCSVIK
jgi:hypothetical protein